MSFISLRPRVQNPEYMHCIGSCSTKIISFNLEQKFRSHILDLPDWFSIIKFIVYIFGNNTA